MTKARLAVAAGNVPAKHAAVEIARQGGNAVDTCLASAIMAWVAEPFFASIGGSGFVAIRAADGAVEVIDGNNAVPEAGASHDGGLKRVFLDYSNGMYTGIGGGSVAVPGVLAAVRLAWERHGNIEWPALFRPAIDAARRGIDFPPTSEYYLSLTHEPIWAAYPPASALFSPDGLLVAGDRLVQSELAESLEAIAEGGPEVFYTGALATEIAAAVRRDGGPLSSQDLASYRAERRSPVETSAWGWRIESNPPPAMGGAVLTYMLSILERTKLRTSVERLRAIIGAEQTAMGFRAERFSEDPGDIAAALDAVEPGRSRYRSASTTHTSAADADGLVCSVTESNGYGSGLVVRGMLLNNTLGEEELNPFGPYHLPPGARCHSNMAPTIATGPERAVGLGSPGADRIVGAIAQTIMSIALDGASLADAVSAPRAHLALKPEGPLLCYEPGLPGSELEWTPMAYDDLHMFFGAVQAASVTSAGEVDAAHDPRRSGATALV